MRYRCYCLSEHYQPLTQQEFEMPAPIGREVVVKVRAAGVCHSDIHIWEGHYDLGGGKAITLKDRGIALPLTLGHEIAGEIAALGPEAKGLSIGQPVLVYPWIGCGSCPTCLAGDENICQKGKSLGVFQHGGYAEYVRVPLDNYCLDITGLDPAQAAPLACSGVTTYSAIRKMGEVIKHAPVVIMGAGGLGLMAMNMLKALGAKGSIVVDIDPAKREAALKAGALAVIDGKEADAAQQIIAATDGGAKRVLDLVGAPSSIELGIASATRGTDIIVVGLFGGATTVPIPYFPLRPLGIRGSYVGNLAELKELVAFAKQGVLQPVQVNRRPLNEANDALMDLRGGKIIGRTVLTD